MNWATKIYVAIANVVNRYWDDVLCRIGVRVKLTPVRPSYVNLGGIPGVIGADGKYQLLCGFRRIEASRYILDESPSIRMSSSDNPDIKALADDIRKAQWTTDRLTLDEKLEFMELMDEYPIDDGWDEVTQTRKGSIANRLERFYRT